MRRILRTSLLLSTLFLISISSAQQTPTMSVPHLIRYGATLKDGNGAPIAATAGVTFAIYQQQEGGAPVWMETQNVTPDAGGNYSVLLGSTTATGLPNDLFSQQEQRWLGVQVQGQPEQARVLLVSVPYAFKAHEAETLGGRSISDFVLANRANSTANGSDTSQESSSMVNNSPSAQPGTATSDGASQDPTNFSGSTTDKIVGVTQSGTGKGISATATSKAVVGTATGSGTAYGVWGVAKGTGGAAVLGTAQATTGWAVGVKGSSTSPLGTGVRGVETSTTGYTKGVSAYVASPAGTAGVFDNAAGGEILSGRNNNVEKFSVDGGGNVTSAGKFTGGGAGLTGIQFSQLSGLLGNSQFSGSYSNAVTLSSTANVFYGDGSHLRGVGGGSYILNGTSQQPNANFNIDGTGTANAFNSATNYRIGGSSVLSTGGATDWNLFLGLGAGAHNVTGQGQDNTFSGYQAGYGNNTGTSNTFYGYRAGYSNTTGGGNTYTGSQAGYFDNGVQNTFTGLMAGAWNTDGCTNTFTGAFAGEFNTTGCHNTFTGNVAGSYNTTGNYNTFSGNGAGYSNTTGNSNTFLGNSAGGNNTTGSDNIYIEHPGPTSGDESHSIRIGTQQNAAYIAGIYGSTSASGIPVYINSDGKLGTQTSSLRFKEQIADMGDSTSALMKLRPVTFLYKPEYDKGQRTLQYGLIAEEVAKVYPELVAYDNDGQPYTVRYQYLSTMLLNEVQKQYRRAEAEAKVIETQQDQIESLQRQNEEFQQRLSRLESLIGTPVQTAQANSAIAISPGGTQ